MRHILFIALLLPSSLLAQTADEKKATIKFLSDLQQSDGGFVPAPIDPKSDAPPRSSLRATSAAVRAIKYFGGEPPNKDKAQAFVKSCYLSGSGAFADIPNGMADVVMTAVGMMATVELDPEPMLGRSIEFLAKNARTFEERRLAVAGMESVKKFAPAVKDWLTEIEKTRNADGTYGKGAARARETGGVIAMLLRSGGKLSDEHRKAVVAALRAGQRADGGFGKADAKGSDGETTYRVMRAFHLLDEMPKDVNKLRQFLASCRNRDGGYGVMPGERSTVGGTYYVAAISKWLPKVK